MNQNVEKNFTHCYKYASYTVGKAVPTKNFAHTLCFEPCVLHTSYYQSCSVTIADCENVIFGLSKEGEKLQHWVWFLPAGETVGIAVGLVDCWHNTSGKDDFGSNILTELVVPHSFQFGLRRMQCFFAEGSESSQRMNTPRLNRPNQFTLGSQAESSVSLWVVPVSLARIPAIIYLFAKVNYCRKGTKGCISAPMANSICVDNHLEKI